jgi:tryptophan 2,3-dioxygenase
MTYGGYLALDELLSAQHPLSDQHDEGLFIVIHQTKELWLKQAVAELRAAQALIAADRLVEVHKILSRVSRIQSVMTLSWDVLATMTPADYVKFRGVLGSSSGFQSAQFRLVEFLLGLKDGGHLKFQDEGSVQREALADALVQPSLWDEAIAALGRAGFDLPVHVLERDWSRPYEPDPAVEAAWAKCIAGPRNCGRSTNLRRSWSISTTRSRHGGTSMS